MPIIYLKFDYTLQGPGNSEIPGSQSITVDVDQETYDKIYDIKLYSKPKTTVQLTEILSRHDIEYAVNQYLKNHEDRKK